MDALSELLRVIPLSGTAFIDADLYAPWAVETPPPSAIAARMAPGAGRIIPYRTALADHFVRCTGMAPMRYLSQWRLRVAADGLRHTDSAIKRIAEAAGFGSTAGFARAFRREFGVSPDRWRRNQRSGSVPILKNFPFAVGGRPRGHR
jgi:hypothetical protein